MSPDGTISGHETRGTELSNISGGDGDGSGGVILLAQLLLSQSEHFVCVICARCARVYIIIII